MEQSDRNKQSDSPINKSKNNQHEYNKLMKDTSIARALIPFEIQQTKPRKITAETNGSENMSINAWKQARAVIIICSCMFYFAFNRALVASIVNSQTSKQFRELFNYTGNVVTTNAILSSVSPLGALFGTILCSYLIKLYSVRYILFRNCLFSIIFTFTTMYTQIIILLIFRFLIGWTIGTYVALIPSFIKEITSKNIAPYFGTFPVMNESLGGLFAFAIGFGLYEATGKVRDTWIIMCTLNIIPLIVVMICIHLDIVYESPIYLLKNQSRQQAVRTYELIYKPEYVETIVRQKELEIKKFYFTQVRLLFNFSNKSILKRKDILIGIHLPVLRKMSGVLVIVLSSGSMIKTVDPKYQRTVPVIISLVYFVSCFLSNAVVKFLSRRATFQLGAVSICILNLCLALFFYYQVDPDIIVSFEIFVIIMYGLTFGPLVWPYLPQVMPARLIPLAQASNWIIDIFTVSLPGVIIAHNSSPWPIFLVFSIWNFLSIIINHFLIVETKLKTINQILTQLNQ